MYLLDTMVISELRKKNVNSGFHNWFIAVDEHNLFLSAITIGEIRKGIYLKGKQDQVAAQILTKWLEYIIKNFSERILPISQDIASIWGEISARIGNSGIDNLIAATAIYHNLTVVTRNVRHFQETGALYLNPWT